MLIIYRVIINFIFLLSPLIIIIRLIKKKEDIKRFKEKFCLFSKVRKKGELLWFHGASVGELLSVVPILEKLEKNNKIKQILVTSNTLSSSIILEKYKFKKITHQFFPIDTNFFCKKFLNYWKPSSVIFIDSEIWPNMIFNLNKRKISINIVNARITRKTFCKWKIFPNFSKKIFGKINLCISSSIESQNYLKKLGVRKIKFFGNLKFSQSENEIFKINNELKNFIKKKKSWCASSTHYPEENFCGLVHNSLKKKYKNLLTIIIPRHIDRVSQIEQDLKKLNLKVHLHESKKIIDQDTDVYIVNSFGKTKAFYYNCKNVFLGGSLINRGGQNPLEAARFGCNILHGPNVQNFKDIYSFLKTNNISSKINNQINTVKVLDRFLVKKKNLNNKQNKLKIIGKKILEKTYIELKLQ